MLEVEDNAGNYAPIGEESGLGMKIVDKRLKNMFGRQYGLTMSYQANEWTRATITIPADAQQPIHTNGTNGETAV